MFLGRLVPEKGIRYLLEAFKDVKTEKKLVIAGGSSDTDEFANELKELAKGDARILFTGLYKDRNWKNYIVMLIYIHFQVIWKGCR